MRTITFFAIIIGFSVSIGFSQKSKTPVKTSPPKTFQTATTGEISDAEWKNLTTFLQAEDWNNSALLASQYLQKLKVDNDKKQLAQLRYFYLYSLAGKILAVTNAAVPANKVSVWKELNAAVGSFIGREFVLPPRRALTECREVLNYICPVSGDERGVRVTATNNAGTMIHSFDYVLFDGKIALDKFIGKEVFLGGKLKKAEFNQELSKLWVMRLIFENGFARVIVPNDK